MSQKKKDKEKSSDEVTADNRGRSHSVYTGSAVGRNTWSVTKAKKLAKIFDEKIFAVAGEAGSPLNKLLEDMAVSSVRHPLLVDCKDHADAIFITGGTTIYAHRAIVSVRCPNLLVKNVKDKPVVKRGTVTVRVADTLVDEVSLANIIAYLYTDEIQFLNLEKEQVVRLMFVAGLYELERVVWLCERYLKAIVSLENWFSLLRSAHTHNVVRAKMLLMQYGAGKFKEIIQKKEGVAQLGLELFREFVVYCTIPPETLPTDPDTIRIESTIRADFQKVYNEMSNTDVIAKLPGDNKPVTCHAALLVEQSESLGRMLVPSHSSDDREGREIKELVLPHNLIVSAKAFQAFLRWAYYKEDKIEPAHAAELVPFARHFNIEPLQVLCEGIIKVGINVESVIPILSLCYNKEVQKFVKKDVYQPSLDFVLANFTAVDFRPLHKKPALMALDILRICQTRIQKGVWKDADELKQAHATKGTTEPVTREKKKNRRSWIPEESGDESSEKKSESEEKPRKKKRESSSVNLAEKDDTPKKKKNAEKEEKAEKVDKADEAKKEGQQEESAKKEETEAKADTEKKDDKETKEEVVEGDANKTDEKEENKEEKKEEDKKDDKEAQEEKVESEKQEDVEKKDEPENKDEPEKKEEAENPDDNAEKEEKAAENEQTEAEGEDEKGGDKSKEKKGKAGDKKDSTPSKAATEISEEDSKRIKEARAKFQNIAKEQEKAQSSSPKGKKKK